ncbi:hypothetical protein BKA01_002983 [Pseudonocardia eucalypti]|nr:hypothetical protein [Pseudonocardia eucalypti]
MGERAGDVGLSAAGRAGNQQVTVLSDPAGLREVQDLGAVETAWAVEVDVLDTGLRA